ncbi:MAG TPA: phosphoribosylanthranilate isomerase, partial [bacterium]|nr:phosphoribosylanthranilate isomerase [bacterium]
MIRIKICGFTRRQDLKEALALGIDFVGFNFWPSSPRYLSPGQAKTLITGLRLTARTVGVFVDADLSLIKDAAVNLRLDGIQLHGKEGPETVAKLKEMFPQTMIIKAIRVGQPHDLENIYRYPADFFLLDSFSPVMAG